MARMEDEKKMSREVFVKKVKEREDLEDLEVESKIILKGSPRDGSERFRLKLILLTEWNICFIVNKRTKYCIR